MYELRLKRGAEQRLLRGHLWVFAGELAGVPAQLADGAVVAVADQRGERLGYGLYAQQGAISVRLVQRGSEPPPPDFIAQRLRAAVARRGLWGQQQNMLRLVHGEADGLPGLIVDRYGSHLVLQIHCAGMEQRRHEVLAALQAELDVQSVTALRRSVHRKHEGLPVGPPELLAGEAPSELLFGEGDLRYHVSVVAGAKGGFFLDQRANRARLRSWVRPGDRVLDLFCGSGGFGLNAARAGAGEVVLADTSRPALERALRSAEVNGLEVLTRQADLFRVLAGWAEEEAGAWDVVVLDPPGLARARSALPTALKAYRKINEAGLRLLRPGGRLLTCSCSQPVGRDAFLATLGEAARRAGRWCTVEAMHGADRDHPVLPGMPETDYLKVALVHAA